MQSELKSGPNTIWIVFIFPGFLGVDPDKLVIVKVSSGYNITKLGP